MKSEITDSGTQTIEIEFETIGTNTDDILEEPTENQKVDENGYFHPQKNEVILQMQINHSLKNWSEIESHITEKLNLTLIGRPWISNNGRHYMTIGFRTEQTEHENWKLETFNWQNSGIRAVTSSRMYQG